MRHRGDDDAMPGRPLTRASQWLMFDAELDLATDLARTAAAAILEVKNSARATSQEKADHSPVTAADLAADRTIRAGLARFDDAVVTEETFTTGLLPARGRVWIVDPLDGTRDFVAGSADYVVQIALVVDGVPRLGVVCQPETGRLWRGVVDGDDTRCERIDVDAHVHRYARATTKTTTKTTTTTTTRLRLAVSVSHPSPVIDALGLALDADLIARGSVGLKIAAILDDEADGYVTDSHHIKVWDTAAPAALMLAAGGSFTSLSSSPLRYDRDVAHDDGAAAFGANGGQWRALLRQALSSLRQG